ARGTISFTPWVDMAAISLCICSHITVRWACNCGVIPFAGEYGAWVNTMMGMLPKSRRVARVSSALTPEKLRPSDVVAAWYFSLAEYSNITSLIALLKRG